MDQDRRQDGTQTRRMFFMKTCQAASVLAIAPVLASCGGSSSNPAGGGGSVGTLPSVTGTLAASNIITVAVDSGPLATVGGAAFVTTTAGNVLVARTAQDTFVAVSSVCTHEVCSITGWSSPYYVCPCHGSEFSTDGAVVRGPAGRALTKYTTALANNVLTITA